LHESIRTAGSDGSSLAVMQFLLPELLAVFTGEVTLVILNENLKNTPNI